MRFRPSKDSDLCRSCDASDQALPKTRRRKDALLKTTAPRHIPSAPDAFTLVLGLALLLGLEAAASLPFRILPPLAHLGLLRLLQYGSLLMLLKIRGFSPSAVGLHRKGFSSGLRTGLIGCGLMGLFALIAGMALRFSGMRPLELIRVPLPHDPLDLFLFFAVGGLIAPLAEELFFRGFLFGYLKRFGWLPALCLSTAAFALPHPGIHVTQWIGGLVFGLAYGISGSLAAPFLIHACGNLVLFTLSRLGASYGF